tara:strand:- start:235 stop:456 length:222 start_codon:yes stop_codon:yes gene_type:complete
MRKDFKYPYRVISRKEEIQSRYDGGFILGTIIGFPIMIINNILRLFMPSNLIKFFITGLIGGFLIMYLIIKYF